METLLNNIIAFAAANGVPARSTGSAVVLTLTLSRPETGEFETEAVTVSTMSAARRALGY